MKPLRVFEAFAGYGSQSIALELLSQSFPQFSFEVVGFSEIDKYAIQAYRAIHGDAIPNLGDISKINWGGIALILTYLHILSLAKTYLQQVCNVVLPRVVALAHRFCGSALVPSKPSIQNSCLWKM